MGTRQNSRMLGKSHGALLWRLSETYKFRLPYTRFTSIRTMGSIPDERRFKADSVAVIGAGPSGIAAAK